MQLPGEFFSIYRKKSGYLLSGRGGYSPPPLSGPTTKKVFYQGRGDFFKKLLLWNYPTDSRRFL